MDCNVIKDLIPLYIDKCCSEESVKLVEEHLGDCENCTAELDSMRSFSAEEKEIAIPEKFSSINAFKASVLQSVLLFVSFVIITVGVALEAASPIGFGNGFWAFTLVVPATGFLFSLANWYFVRLYKTRKTFSNFSFLFTFIFSSVAFILVCNHYGFTGEIISGLSEVGMLDFFEAIFFLFLVFFCYGVMMTVLFCIFSKVFSNMYAKWLGKE